MAARRVPDARIRTPRLLLRPFAPGDAHELWTLWNDARVRRYLWDDQPVSRAAVREQIATSRRLFIERGFGHFAVRAVAAAGSIVGFSGLRPCLSGAEVELLYALRPACWGRGLATEAARAILRFGFDEAGLEEIYAGADPPNLASFRVMERLGMTFYRDLVVHDRPARYYRITREAFAAP